MKLCSTSLRMYVRMHANFQLLGNSAACSASVTRPCGYKGKPDIHTPDIDLIMKPCNCSNSLHIFAYTHSAPMSYSPKMFIVRGFTGLIEHDVVYARPLAFGSGCVLPISELVSEQGCQ